MPTHQETNVLELGALIKDIQNPNPKTHQIEYRHGGRFVLIGKGHTLDNNRNVNEAPVRHEGTMMLRILPKNVVEFFIDGNTYHGKDDQGRQTTEKKALEGAVEMTLSTLNTKNKTKWKAKFDWA